MKMNRFFLLLTFTLAFSSSLFSFESKKGVLVTKYGELKYEVHYPEEKEEFAQIILQVMETKALDVIEYFKYIPDNPVHFVVNETSKGANGSATVFPTNIIKLNDYPPLGKQFLATSSNWREGLIIHELTHILTIGQLRGFIKGISYIFGSVVNGFAGIIPRWYAEGIAVWAESTFLDHGRLKNSQLIAVTKNKLSDPKFCSKIECLDTPNGYPYGSYSYWAGALFINYIETKKPGSIRCILTADSYRMPFYLNRAFRKCLGKSSQELFVEFRSQFIKEQKLAESELTDWQKGMSSSMNQLYWVEGGKRGQYIKKLNFDSRESNIIELDKVYTGFARRSWNLQTSKNIGPVILSSFGGKHHVIKENKTSVLGQKSQYIYSIDENKYILLNYKDGKWLIQSWTDGQKPETLSKITGHDLYNPKVFLNGKDVILDFVRRPLNRKARSIVRWDVYKKEIVTTMKLKTDLVYLDSCVEKNEPIHWLRNKNIIYKMNLSNNETIKYNSSLPMLSLYFADNLSVIQLRNNKRKMIKMNCEQLERHFVEEKTWSKIEIASSEGPKQTDEIPVSKNVEKLFYPGLRHFKPHYWLLNFTSINAFTSWQASTVLTDPANRHQFGLTAKYFPDITKSAYDFLYNYKRSHFSMGLSSGKDYSRNSVSEVTQERDYFQVNSSLSYDNWGGSLYYLQTNTNDFISARDFERIGAIYRFQVNRVWQRSFLQNFSFGLGNYFQKTKNREDFWGHEIFSKLNLNLFSRLKLHLKGTYGKTSNDSIRSGVIYGGGNNETLFGGTRVHDFYGLNFGDLFGREIWTARSQLKFLISDYYSGWGLFPWFIKKINFLAGIDVAKSDFSFIDTDILRDQRITSYHAGVSFESQLFYLMPANISLIGANVHAGAIKDDIQLLLLFSSPLNIL